MKTITRKEFDKAKKNKYPLVYFIIAVGGHLKKPDVSRMVITKEEVDEFCSDESGSEEDAINYFLEEELGAWSQHFSPAIALTENEFKEVIKQAHKPTP